MVPKPFGRVHLRASSVLSFLGVLHGLKVRSPRRGFTKVTMQGFWGKGFTAWKALRARFRAQGFVFLGLGFTGFGVSGPSLGFGISG